MKLAWQDNNRPILQPSLDQHATLHHENNCFSNKLYVKPNYHTCEVGQQTNGNLQHLQHLIIHFSFALMKCYINHSFLST